MKKQLLIVGLLIIVAPSIYASPSYPVDNLTPFNMNVRWDFLGKSWSKNIAPANKHKVNSILLNKGFSDIYAKDVKLGQPWGVNPETGEELKITTDMIDKNGNVQGIKNRIYASTGQAKFHNFLLIVVPEKNENGNWVPSFKLGRPAEKLREVYRDKLGGTILDIEDRRFVQGYHWITPVALKEKTPAVIPVNQWMLTLKLEEPSGKILSAEWKPVKTTPANNNTFIFAKAAPVVGNQPVTLVRERQQPSTYSRYNIPSPEHIKLFQSELVF